VAGIALPNDASVAVRRKFGFTDVGVFEKYAVKHGNAAFKDLTTAVRLDALEDDRPAHPRTFLSPVRSPTWPPASHR